MNTTPLSLDELDELEEPLVDGSVVDVVSVVEPVLVGSPLEPVPEMLVLSLPPESVVDELDSSGSVGVVVEDVGGVDVDGVMLADGSELVPLLPSFPVLPAGIGSSTHPPRTNTDALKQTNESRIATV